MQLEFKQSRVVLTLDDGSQVHPGDLSRSYEEAPPFNYEGDRAFWGEVELLRLADGALALSYHGVHEHEGGTSFDEAGERTQVSRDGGRTWMTVQTFEDVDSQWIAAVSNHPSGRTVCHAPLPKTPNVKVAGRYEILQPLNHSAWTRSDLALDHTSGTQVVVEQLLHLGWRPEDQDHLRREKPKLLALAHRALLRVLEVQEIFPQYIVSEAPPLSAGWQLLTTSGKMTVPRVIELGCELLSALSVAHESDVLHGSLRPDVIHLGPSGGIKIRDIGLETLLHHGEAVARDERWFRAAWIAPERWSGGPPSVAADLHSVALCLFQALSGEAPYRDGSRLQPTQTNMPLRALPADVPAALSAVVARAADGDPARRFGDARAMKHALVAAPSSASQ